MTKQIDIKEQTERDREHQVGYTLIEILAVMAIMVFAVLATQGMIRNYKKFSAEEIATQRLKELARLEHIYRFGNDPTVNPNGTYATFFDLQNANLLPELYEQSDEKRHTVNAYVPSYKLNFMRSAEEDNLDPDAYNFLIQAVPLTNSLDLKTFYVQEDGEVYWQRYLWLQTR
jgi:prepilin-type N-terminal cleavage/methylation domain-containing protein